MDAIQTHDNGKRHLYEDVARKVERMIIKGAFRPGERIPSIRLMSQQLCVSINTITAAYAHLEDLGLVAAKPQSGYYVRPPGPAPLTERPVRADDKLSAKPVTLTESALRMMRSLADPPDDSGIVSLTSAAPSFSLLPVHKIIDLLAAESRKHPVASMSYGSARGDPRLRAQIAKRLFAAGCVVAPDEITITSGCLEAVTLALQAVCRAGETVAIASPAHFIFLAAIQRLGLKVLEIPSKPSEGINIEVLRYAIQHTPIKAVLVISNFSNPTGCLMPDDNKRHLVELLGANGIPLIEDDVNGDLGFGSERPKSVKAYDPAGLVLQCGSFSKTLVPGFRVGWIVAGRFQQDVERLKSAFNMATASPTQLAVAKYVATGGYDRHLRTLRRAYSTQTAQMRFAIGKHFPPSTRVSRPAGGVVLWVEMPEKVDALTLYGKALELGIGIAPGSLFTSGNDFRNCIRLSASAWSPRIEGAIQTVGALARELAGAGR